MIRFGSKLIINRWKFVALLALIFTTVSLFQLRHLTFDVQPDAIFSSQNQTSIDLQKFHDLFGPDENDLVILFEGDNLFSIEHHKTLHEFRNQLSVDERVDHVTSVFDLRQPGSAFFPLFPKFPGDRFDTERYKKAVLEHPLAANQLVGKDGRLLMFWVKLKGDDLSINELIPLVESIEESAKRAAENSGANTWLAGHPAIRYEVLFTLQKAMWRNCSIAVVVSALVSFALFQRLVNVAIAVIPPMVGVCWVLGLIAMNQIPIGGLTTALPSLIFVIGLTNSIHIQLDANRNMTRGISVRNSVYRALLKIGPACLLTSITTMIGFGSLLLSRTDSVQQFGFWSAFGTAIVLGAVLLIQPVMLLAVQSKPQSDGMQTSKKWVSIFLGCLHAIQEISKPISWMFACKHPRNIETHFLKG